MEEKDLKDVFTEASLSDSYVYGLFNTGNEIQTRIIKGLQNGILLDSSYIQEQLIQIQKTRISPISDKVLDAYRSGLVRLVYVKNYKMTKSLPFILHKTNDGKVKASIFVSNYATLNREEDALVIPMKSLYILMESAYIGLYMQLNKNIIQRNTTVMRVCNYVYTQMFMRILNKEYALSLDNNLHDKVSYTVSRFFLETVWGVQNESLIYTYAAGTSLNPDHGALKILHEEYSMAGIHNLTDLFEFMKKQFPRMQTLTLRYFVERYINTYNGTAILAIDYLPYVFFVIINMLLGGFLVNQGSLNDIIKETPMINKFYPELTKII
jgi:hypothetical protein